MGRAGAGMAQEAGNTIQAFLECPHGMAYLTVENTLLAVWNYDETAVKVADGVCNVIRVMASDDNVAKSEIANRMLFGACLGGAGKTVMDDLFKGVAQSRAELAAASKAGGIGEPVLFGQRRCGPRFSVDPRYPQTSGRSIADVAADLRNPNNPLSPDDLPITAFRDPRTGSLVSMNTRTRAALAEAGLEPTRVEIADLNALSLRQRQKYLRRLNEQPIIDSPLPGLRVPVTPSMSNLDVMIRPDGSPYIIGIP